MIHSVFPIPMYIGKIEDLDIELPFFGQNHVVSQVIPELRDKIFDIIGDMLEETGSVRQPLKLNDMWFNRYDDNRPMLEYHFHQNCSWTGTYFPEDANHTTVIYNPMANLVQSHYPKVEQASTFNQELLSINDFTKGNLMIHPSWVAHSVFWNGGEPSHSISFDVSYDLPIGDKEYGSYRE